nr:immunoglobulin light chain junction region [Macaca mulatta]
DYYCYSGDSSGGFF